MGACHFHLFSIHLCDRSHASVIIRSFQFEVRSIKFISIFRTHAISFPPGAVRCYPPDVSLMKTFWFGDIAFKELVEMQLCVWWLWETWKCSKPGEWSTWIFMSHCGLNSYFGLPPPSLTFSLHKITAEWHLDFMQKTTVILQTSGWLSQPNCTKTALQQSNAIMYLLTRHPRNKEPHLRLTIIFISNSSAISFPN